ncbi:MAG: DUF4065 domain-containing protein [Candidatus Marinimicrobia bacterium]|nr:DUF4065 domain-containing protein [Candidatus Neomarinimicrobiota bacterium]
MAQQLNSELLGQRLRHLRESRELSQADIAIILNISRPSISLIEKGERKISGIELAKLAEYFGVSLDSIVDPKKGIGVMLEQSKRSVSNEGLRISVPQDRADKFESVLLYILNKVGSRPNIGETVIYKLLYFIDFNYYEKYETQLVGATYIKNHHGPTPIEFKKIIDSMIKNETVEQVTSQYFQYPQRKYLPLKEPDLSILSAQEIEMIDRVLSQLASMNASELSSHSHEDIPWKVADNGKLLQYESVFYRTDQYSVREYPAD